MTWDKTMASHERKILTAGKLSVSDTYMNMKIAWQRNNICNFIFFQRIYILNELLWVSMLVPLGYRFYLRKVV